MPRQKSPSYRRYHEIVDEFVAPYLCERGYARARDETFWHWNGDALYCISSMFTKDRGADEGFMDACVAVGFRSLAEFLHQPLGLDLGSLADRKRPYVFATDVENLHPPRETRHWFVTAESDARSVAAAVTSDLEQFAFPFLARYTTLAAVVRKFEQLAARGNVLLSELIVVAAFQAMAGDWKQAQALIERRKQASADEWAASRRYSADYDVENCQKFLDWLTAKQRVE